MRYPKLKTIPMTGLGIHQEGHCRLTLGHPKLPRRTRVSGRQGTRSPGGDNPLAEALPRPQGRVVRYPRRRKRRASRPSRGGRSRRGGPPDSAPASRGALGRTPGALALVRGSYLQGTRTRLGRERRCRDPRSIGVDWVTKALTEANAPTREALVAVDKRPDRLDVLPANSAGQVRTDGVK